MLGSVYCYQGGHQLSNLFLHKLLKSKKKYKTLMMDKNSIKENKNSNSNFKLAVNA